MDYNKRWEKSQNIGQGGQGVVYRVLDKTKYDIHNIYGSINQGFDAFKRFTDSSQYPDDLMKLHFPKFQNGIIQIVESEDKNKHGALKELHQPENARDAEHAEERLKREISAMSLMKHPNLLKIIDSDPEGKWYVSQFYLRGTLSHYNHGYAGDFVKSLRAFRYKFPPKLTHLSR